MARVDARLLLIAILLIASRPSLARAQDPKAALDAAGAALGASTLTSIQVSGHGSDYVVGQMYDGHSPWSRFDMPSFTMTIDYATPAMRTERTRAQGEDPP